MNKANQFRKYVAVGIACLALLAASCNTDEDDGTALPDGKYPMTFTTQVEGLTATRATTDNSWDGTEEVAIQIGNAVKKYKAASDGALSAEDTSNPFYWTNNTMTVSAWYASTYLDAKPTSFTVAADQDNNSGSGYQASDFLYAYQSVTFNKSTAPSLTFKHLPVKVVVNLKKGEGITDTEVQSAAVALVNQNLTSGAIADDWKVTQATTGSSTITPNVLSSPTSGYQKSVQALLVPQQMQGQKFIKVTIGTGGTARDYYYTPTQEDDANLQAGNQYTYDITVKKSGLSVESVTASWNDNASTDQAKQATFHITCPNSYDNAENISISLTNPDNDTYTTQDKSFTISYKLKEQASISNRFYIKQGLADIASTSNDGVTFTTTVSNIRSDLQLSFGEQPLVGDYYYSDNTWSDFLYTDKTCIGIVFYTGAGNGDSAESYGTSLQSGIHGYAVSLQNNSAFNWTYSTETSADTEVFNGYSNSQTIIQDSRYSQSSAPVPWACMNYTPQATEGTSGWYMPSIAQLKALWKVQQIVESRLETVSGGEWLKSNYGYSYSSTYFNNNRYYCLNLETGEGHNGMYWGNPEYSRSILTF